MMEKPSLIEHIELGRDLKAAEAALDKVLEHRRFFGAKREHRLANMLRSIYTIQSTMEDALYRDYPGIGDAGLAVYYRGTDEQKTALKGLASRLGLDEDAGPVGVSKP